MSGIRFEKRGDDILVFKGELPRGRIEFCGKGGDGSWLYVPRVSWLNASELRQIAGKIEEMQNHGSKP